MFIIALLGEFSEFDLSQFQTTERKHSDSTEVDNVLKEFETITFGENLTKA